MKKYITILFISLLMILPNNIEAKTREDITSYINEQQTIICDTSTKQLFNTYKILFTRMMKEKDLSETDLNNIYSYIEKAINLVKENNICKESDLDNYKNIKTKVKDYLYSAMMIVYDAKALGTDNTDNGIVIDKSTNTIDIYQNGNLYDKVDVSVKTFNSVGPNHIVLYTLIILIILLIISLVTYLVSLLSGCFNILLIFKK